MFSSNFASQQSFSLCDPEVRVIEYPAINRQERNIVGACRGDEELVSRVPVERAWKLGRGNGDLRGQVQEANPGISQCLLQPLQYRQSERQPSQLHKLGHLPAGDDANAQPSALMTRDY